jgi:transposase
MATTPAPVADGDVTPAIHQALRGTDLLPGRPMADTAYVDAELLLDSRREYGVDLIGPTRPDYRWQSRAGEGFAASDFAIDWDRQRAICPDGRASLSWSPAVDRGHNEVIKIKSSAKDCGVCPARDRCSEAKRRSIIATRGIRQQYQLYRRQRAQRKGRTRSSTSSTPSPGRSEIGIWPSRMSSSGAWSTRWKCSGTRYG